MVLKNIRAAVDSIYSAPLAVPAKVGWKCAIGAARPFVNCVKNIANFFNGESEGYPPIFKDVPKSKPLTIAGTLATLMVGGFIGLSTAMTVFEVANPLIFVIGIAGAAVGMAATPFVVGTALAAVGAVAGLAVSPLAAGYGVKKLWDRLRGKAPELSAPAAPEKAPGEPNLFFRLGNKLTRSFEAAMAPSATAPENVKPALSAPAPG